MAPDNVTSYDTFGTSIMVKWLPIPEDHHKGILLGYKIYYQEYDLSGPLWPMHSINTDGVVDSWELQGLNLTSNYSIQVAGYTSIGVGNISDVIFGISGMYGEFKFDYFRNSFFVVPNFLFAITILMLFNMPYQTNL